MGERGDVKLPTTVIGSYPSEGLPPRRALQRAVEDQIAAGIDMIADGQVRGDMIAIFARRIPGFRQAPDGVWEVEDALDQPAEPVTLEDYRLAKELAAGRAEVKAVITGPITLALSCRTVPGAPYIGSADPSLIMRLADFQMREAIALASAGARVIQVDEPLLATALGSRVSVELANAALSDLAALPGLAMLHICGDVRAIASDLLLLPFDVFSIENTRIANLAAFDLDQIDAVGASFCVGVVDTQDAEVESAETIGARIAEAQALMGTERLWLAPDCGLRMLPRAAARAKLGRLAEATQEARARV
jgi:5-methyltetrahydropteroyltriglutamate--homocysteine methyltransferase